MASRTFADIFDESLDMLRAGASIDDCVAPYPEHADELRAQLRVVERVLATRPLVQPEPAAQAQGRAHLLSALAQMRDEPEPTLGLVAPLRALFLGIGSRLPQALPAVLAMLVLGGAAWGAAAAAGNPNPGNWFVGSSSTQEERIELRGTITAIEPPVLTINTDTGEVSVQIDDGTEFEDDSETSLALADFNVGDFVKISAFRNEAGVLIAREVELEIDDEDDDAGAKEDAADDDDADPSGPSSPNSGPGNAEDADEDDDDGDNSGPGKSNDAHEDKDDDDDRSGPSPNSGPGNSGHDDEDEEPENERDNSGPGSSDDDEDEPEPDDDDEPDDDQPALAHRKLKRRPSRREGLLLFHNEFPYLNAKRAVTFG